MFICRWFCHFDDDQYVNVLALEDKLRSLDWDQDWYLGKPSIEKPLEILDRDSPDMKVRIFIGLDIELLAEIARAFNSINISPIFEIP